MLVTFLVGIFTARYLGPSGYGVINYVASYVALFTAVSSLGLNGIIVNELVKDKDKGNEGKIIGTALIMRLVSSCISMFAVVFILYLLKPNDKVIFTVAILQSMALLFSIFDTIDYWYQSQLRSKVTTLLSMIAYTTAAVYKVIILVLDKSIEWFAFSATLDALLVGIFLFISYFANHGKKLEFSFKYGRYMLKQGYHFMIAAVMATIYAQVDKVMIGQMLGTKQVGLYSVAIVICGLWSFVPASVIASVSPIIMSNKQNNEALYVKRLKQTYTGIIWSSILYATFVTIFSKYIIMILYGAQYAGANGPLIIAVWYCAFAYIGAIKNIWLLCEGLQKYELIFTSVGASMNILVNYLLIPIWGINGAAIATLLTQCLTNFIMPTLFKKTRKNTRYVIESTLFMGVDANIILNKIKTKLFGNKNTNKESREEKIDKEENKSDDTDDDDNK